MSVQAPDMDDIDDEIYEEVMKDYNFGGGEDSEVAKGPDGKPKTRKQVGVCYGPSVLPALYCIVLCGRLREEQVCLLP